MADTMRNLDLLSLLGDLRWRLDRKQSLASIAQRAGISRFHLHRHFRKAFTESPREFIERLRLEQAAAQLLTSRQSVCEIALEAGFSSHEVFVRAFRRKYGSTPARYRAAAMPGASALTRARHKMLSAAIGPCLHTFHLPLRHSTRKSTMPTPSVSRQQYPGQDILLIRRSIPRAQLQPMLAECFGKLFGHGAKRGLPIAGWPVARYLSVGPGLWTVEAAMPLAAPASSEGEMESGTLPAGPVALAVHVGPYEQLPETYAAIEKWMQANDARPGGAPWEWYVTDPAQHPDPAEWKTEVYWPLEK